MTYTASVQAKKFSIVGSYLTLALLLPLTLHAGQRNRAEPRLTAFEADGKWGYKDAQGKVIIRPRFALAEDFSPQGIAPVVDEAGWAYINAKGEIVLRPFVLDNGPDCFSEGVARFVSDGKLGFFNQSGKVVIEPGFDFAWPFSEGRAVVCQGCTEEAEGEYHVVTGGKWGFIDKRGVIVIALIFERAENFQGGTARVKLHGQWRQVDKKGKLIELASVGSASMEEDGTIVLRLAVTGPEGEVGDGLLRYAPTHPKYAEVLRHLGGLKKGETKPVPPWPEQAQ
jgi:hypothetical protein